MIGAGCRGTVAPFVAVCPRAGLGDLGAAGRGDDTVLSTRGVTGGFGMSGVTARTVGTGGTTTAMPGSWVLDGTVRNLSETIATTTTQATMATMSWAKVQGLNRKSTGAAAAGVSHGRGGS